MGKLQNTARGGALSGRVHLIDEVRGAAIVLMVLYHAGYDLVAIFGLDIPFFFSTGMNLVRDMMAGAFIFISGCACRFSHSNLHRGVLTLGFGLAMSLVTYLIIPDQVIRFGVLHCLGLCMIFYGLLETPLCKLPAGIAMSCAAAAFYLLFSLPSGIVGGLTYHFQVPRALYSTSFLFPLGLPDSGFFSSDYYPLIPWLFLFLCGSYGGFYVKSRRLPDFVYRKHLPPLAFIGRHTLPIYLFHQPIVFGLFSLLFSR